MATTQQKGEWWADWRCNPLTMVTVGLPGVDRNWNLPVADALGSGMAFVRGVVTFKARLSDTSCPVGELRALDFAGWCLQPWVLRRRAHQGPASPKGLAVVK